MSAHFTKFCRSCCRLRISLSSAQFLEILDVYLPQTSVHVRWEHMHDSRLGGRGTRFFLFRHLPSPFVFLFRCPLLGRATACARKTKWLESRPYTLYISRMAKRTLKKYKITPKTRFYSTKVSKKRKLRRNSKISGQWGTPLLILDHFLTFFGWFHNVTIDFLFSLCLRSFAAFAVTKTGHNSELIRRTKFQNHRDRGLNMTPKKSIEHLKLLLRFANVQPYCDCIFECNDRLTHRF